jgi:hypothetical protein
LQQQPLQRRGPGLLAELAVQRSLAHGRLVGDVGQGQRFGDPLPDPGHCRLERTAVRGGLRVRDQLRLSAGSLRCQHDVPGHLGGDR